MDEHFHESQRLDKDALKSLLTRSDSPAIGRFAVQYGLLLGSAAATVAAPELGWPLWVLFAAIFVFAVMTVAMFAVVHESGHNTAFASRSLNRMVCWLACVPIFYTPTGFREFHFAHHRHTHDPLRDPEISLGGMSAPSLVESLPNYLLLMSGFPIVMFKFVMVAGAAVGGPEALWQKLLHHVTPKARRQLVREARLTMLLYIAWFVAGALWLPGLLWLLAAEWLGHFLLMIYVATEHNGLPHEGDILERTRSNKAPAWLRWLVWNMSYHAEHHAYPAVPWHALPRLHSLLEPELRHKGQGYFTFHRKVLASLLKGKAFQQ